MLMRCRFGLSVWSKKIFAQGKIKWKKIYARQLTLKKYSCYGLKKFKQGIWWQKKFLRLENFPPPHNFSNGPSLRTQKGVRLCPAFLAETVETGTKNCSVIEVTHGLRRKLKKRLNLELFRKVSVHEFCRLKALITLEQVNITEWSKTIIIIRLPNISGINRNFFVLEAMSQMFGWQYNTIQFNKMQSNAMQCNAMQCNTIQYNKNAIIFV